MEISKTRWLFFQKLCTSEDTDATKVSSDLANAVNCLNRLGNQKQFDELIEKSISAHSVKLAFVADRGKAIHEHDALWL